MAFRQILPKVLPEVYIFRNRIMTKLKKLIGNKSVNTKQCPAGLSPRIIHLNLYGKPWDGEEYWPTAKNLLISTSRKILLDKFTPSTMKSVIPSPSNSNFHLITLYKLSPIHPIYPSHCCCIIFLKFRLFMYVHVMLILINQCLLNAVFSITKTLKGQISPKYHFYYSNLSMLSGKLCFS